MAGSQTKVAKQAASRGGMPVTAKPGTHNVTEDTKALIDHVAENPLLYAAAAGFVVLCVIAGILIMLGRQSAAREEMTQLARAVVNEDPALRAAQLEPLSQESGGQAAAAAYLAGEAELKAGNYDKAEEYLQRVADRFRNSDYAPNAMDALAFLAENRGDNDAALQRYRQVQENWPDSFMARIAPSRIGRVLESLGRNEEAVEAYCDQFRKFPRSWSTSLAMAAIDKLTKSSDAAAASAAKGGFKKLSQEFPALFEELYKHFFVPAEEANDSVAPADVAEVGVGSTTEDAVPSAEPATSQPSSETSITEAATETSGASPEPPAEDTSAGADSTAENGASETPDAPAADISSSGAEAIAETGAPEAEQPLDAGAAAPSQ